MVFIHPAFLWGLLALIIPIIIHLFDFRRNKKVDFPDIRFLKQVKQSSRKPLRLKQLLILASRLAFVFFLVMVFAQPILPTNSNKQLKSGAKLIYIDNSQSMSSLINTKESAIENAKAIGESIINQLPSGQNVIIVTNDNINQLFVPNTLAEASEKISTINLSDKRFSLGKLASAINQNGNQTKGVSDVFILSDFQKSNDVFGLNRLDSTITYWLSPLRNESTNNCVIDSVYLVNSDISDDGTTQIEIIISNKGDVEKENLPIKIFVGNRQVSATTVTVGSYKSEKVSFSLGKISEAESGYVQVEDYPNTFDNVFYFSLPKKRAITIFEIQGETPSSYIETVFGNENLFLKLTNNYQNIENNLFEQADFVVLNQVERPEVELINQLMIFSENGGSVLIIPNVENEIEAYKKINTAIKKTPVSQKQKLQSPSSKIPFFTNILERTSRTLGMPSVTPVLGLGDDRSAILSLEDGTPYLSEISPNLYIISSPLIDSLSSFQTHALFVPIMYSLAAQSAAPTSQLFARMNDDFYDLRIDSLDFRDIVKLKSNGIEIVPEKIKVGNYWRFSFPKDITHTGVYKVDVGDENKGHLAINLDRKESDLSTFNETELRELFQGSHINFLDAFSTNNKISTSFDSGTALWRYALIICLLFLLSETLLIRFL